MRRLVLLLPFCAACATAFGGTWADLWSTPEQQAQHLLESGRAAEAAQRFSDPRRRAFAELKAHRYPEAAKQLESLEDVDSLYNRGNALARAGDLRGALAAYDEALSRAPDNRDVRHNRDLVARAVQEQKPQQQGAGGNGRHSGSQSSGSQSSGSQSSGSQSSGSQSSGSQPSSTQSSGTSAAHQAQTRDSDTRESPTHSGQARAGAHPQSAAHADQRAQGAVSQSSGAQNNDAQDARRDAQAAADIRQKQQLAAGATEGTGAGRDQALHDDVTAPEAARKAAAAPPPKPVTEESLALDQWLRRIPDDSGGLLQRKFLIEHMMKQRGTDR